MEVSALAPPFRVRLQSTVTDDTPTASVVVFDEKIDDFNGIPTDHINPSSPGSRRNAVVESFFADTNPATTISSSTTSSIELSREIRQRATDLKEFLVYSRRSLHQHPELMYQEQTTSAYIQSVLRELDIPFTTGWAVNTHQDRFPGPGGYGVVADIGTGKEPCVLLRADMDALPILEQTEGIDEFKSRNEGRMHACG